MGGEIDELQGLARFVLILLENPTFDRCAAIGKDDLVESGVDGGGDLEGSLNAGGGVFSWGEGGGVAATAAGFWVNCAAALSFAGTTGFGPGAGLNRYCETSSTSIISASAIGRRFSKEGGWGDIPPGLLGMVESQSHSITHGVVAAFMEGMTTAKAFEAHP